MDFVTKSSSSKSPSSSSSSPSKQNNNSSQQQQNVSRALSQKRKKLLVKKAEFAKTEENLRQRSEPAFVQNIDGKANVNQSHKTYQQMTKLLQRNAKDLQLAEMRLNAASELIKRGIETIKVTTKERNSSVEALSARFQAFKIRTESEFEAAREKLRQEMRAEDVMKALQTGLDRLLRNTDLEERVKNMRKVRDHGVQLLEMEYEQLLDHISVLESKFEATTNANLGFWRRSDDLKVELEEIRRTDIDNLDEAKAEEDDLLQQLDACTQECDDVVTGLSSLKEQEEAAVKERKLDEEIASLKAELEDYMAQDNDDPEVALLHYKNIREGLQEEINEQFMAIQDEIKQVEIDLRHAENELASTIALLDGQQHDWSKEIENAVTEGEQLGEAIDAERKASVAFRNEDMKIDTECSRLELEAKVVRASSNAAMLQWQNEISDLKMHLKKLTMQQVTLCCGTAHSPAVQSQLLHPNDAAKSSPHEAQGKISGMPAAKNAYLLDGTKEGNLNSLWNGAAYELDEVDIPEPLSEDDFNRGAASRPQWMNSIDDDGAHTSDFRSGMQGSGKEFEDKRPMDSEGTGKIPSDIHDSHMEQADANANGVVRADASVENYFPLPPPAFGSPLSTDDDTMDTAAAEGNELSDSELDQSVWTEFSTAMKE